MSQESVKTKVKYKQLKLLIDQNNFEIEKKQGHTINNSTFPRRFEKDGMTLNRSLLYVLRFVSLVYSVLYR